MSSRRFREIKHALSVDVVSLAMREGIEEVVKGRYIRGRGVTRSSQSNGLTKSTYLETQQSGILVEVLYTDTLLCCRYSEADKSKNILQPSLLYAM